MIAQFGQELALFLLVGLYWADDFEVV